MFLSISYNLFSSTLFNGSLIFESHSWGGILDTTLCNYGCQWLATGQWYSPDTPVSSTNKTDRHDVNNWNSVESGIKHNNPNPGANDNNCMVVSFTTIYAISVYHHQTSWIQLLTVKSQIKDYKIGICCFSTEHSALKRKSSESE
jgi:hypothetical protein